MTPLRVVFNWDSTLVTIEGSAALAEHKGIDGVAELTNQAMNGEASIQDVFRQRFALLRPTLKDLEWLAGTYAAHTTPGAREIVAHLTEAGHQVFVVSAAYRTAILEPAKQLGIQSHRICAVDVLFDEQGEAHYDAENVLASDGGMEVVLAEIAKAGPTIYIGDSVPDAQAGGAVDLFIGFGGVIPRDEVASLSPIYVREPTLMAVAAHIDAFAGAPVPVA